MEITEVLDLLYELHQTKGQTIVMVLHDLNQACRYADCLIALKDGKTYAQGTPAQIMTEKMVYDVFNTESCIINDPIPQFPISNSPLCLEGSLGVMVTSLVCSERQQ